MLPWLVPAALASTPVVRLDTDARSVVAVAERDGREQVALCADDGTGGDEVPGDHLWACGEVDLNPGGRLGVIIDGRRLAGPWPLEGDPGARPGVDVARGVVSASPPEAGPPGEARPARAALLVEVDRGPTDQAWMLDVSGPLGRDQLPCQDNGAFPDRVRNDDVAACATASPGAALAFELRTSADSDRGALTWPEGIAVQAARWTKAGIGARTDRSLLPPPPESAPEPDAQPPAPPGAPAPGPTEDRDWLAVLIALGVGLGAWRIWRGPPLSRRLTAFLPVEPAERLEVRPGGDLEAAVRERAREGPVVLVLPECYKAPWAAPGPVLRARTGDVADLLEGIEEMRLHRPLGGISVVVLGRDTLANPSGLGVDPLDRLLRESDRTVRILLLETA